jgi:sRNA-binding regulator protein Hfq
MSEDFWLKDTEGNRAIRRPPIRKGQQLTIWLKSGVEIKGEVEYADPYVVCLMEQSLVNEVGYPRTVDIYQNQIAAIARPINQEREPVAGRRA